MYKVLPFTPATFWTQIAIIVPAIISLLVILPPLYKNENMVFLTILSFMLVLSQLFFILYFIFEKIIYDYSSDPTKTGISSDYNILAYLFLGLFYVIFCVTHWMYAFKYWVIAIDMQLTLRQEAIPKNLPCLVNFIYYGCMFLNVVFSVFSCTVRGMNLVKLMNISWNLLVAIQFVSCIFLFDSSRRIVSVTRKNPDLKINVKAIIIHNGSYFIYLVGLIYFEITVYN